LIFRPDSLLVADFVGGWIVLNSGNIVKEKTTDFANDLGRLSKDVNENHQHCLS